MSRILLFDGTALLDGQPLVIPVTAFVPTWNGATRQNPGETEWYASDRLSGAQLLAQRPKLQHVLHTVLGDLAELGSPLGALSEPGLLLENADTEEGNVFDLSAWTATDASVSGSEFSPTNGKSGVEEAFSVTATADGGNIVRSVSVGNNLNANTFVFSIWGKRNSAADVAFDLDLNGTTDSQTLTDKWQRFEVSSPSVATTTATATITITNNGDSGIFWAPNIVDTGTPAAAARGAGSTIAGGGDRVRSALSGDFAWPASPWTMLCEFSPLWPGNDGQAHVIIQAQRGLAATQVFQLQKSAANFYLFGLLDRGGNNRTASGAAQSFNSRVRQQIIVRLNEDGSLDGWENGTAFSTPITAPNAFVETSPDAIILGGQNSSEAADVVLHRFEVHDEGLDPAVFF